MTAESPVGESQRPSVGQQATFIAGLFVIVALIATAGSLATVRHTDGWYREVEKVPWNPPDAVFGPAWTTLYVMIVIAGFLLWRSGYAGIGQRHRAGATLRLFGVQLILNALWTPIFFAGYPLVGRFAWWLALIVIVLLIIAVALLVVRSKRFSRVAMWLLIPYLLWLGYAMTLNAGIIVLN